MIRLIMIYPWSTVLFSIRCLTGSFGQVRWLGWYMSSHPSCTEGWSWCQPLDVLVQIRLFRLIIYRHVGVLFLNVTSNNKTDIHTIAKYYVLIVLRDNQSYNPSLRLLNIWNKFATFSDRRLIQDQWRYGSPWLNVLFFFCF